MKTTKIAMMMMSVVSAVLASAACSTTAKVSTIPGMGVSMPLGRSDYTILGVAQGQACATESCFLGSCNKKAEIAGEELLDGRAETVSLRDVNTAPQNLGPFTFLLGLGNPGPTGSEIAEKIALFKAIESIPNADAIIQPRKEIDIDKNDILGISTTTKSCVKVVGKAIHVKSDAEMNARK